MLHNFAHLIGKTHLIVMRDFHIYYSLCGRQLLRGGGGAEKLKTTEKCVIFHIVCPSYNHC